MDHVKLKCIIPLTLHLLDDTKSYIFSHLLSIHLQILSHLQSKQLNDICDQLNHLADSGKSSNDSNKHTDICHDNCSSNNLSIQQKGVKGVSNNNSDIAYASSNLVSRNVKECIGSIHISDSLLDSYYDDYDDFVHFFPLNFVPEIVPALLVSLTVALSFHQQLSVCDVPNTRLMHVFVEGNIGTCKIKMYNTCQK